LDADGQQSSATAVGKEAEVADANKGSRQQMQQEATEGLVSWKAHQLLLIAVCGVTSAEAYPVSKATSLWLEIGTRCV
jgi:hypothetical protein